MSIRPGRSRSTPDRVLPFRTRAGAIAIAVVIAAGVAAITTYAGSPSSTVSMFGSGVPGNAVQIDPSPVELGVKFRSTQTGWIVGVRYYAGRTSTAIPTGSIWSLSGLRLAKASFKPPTQVGWQEVRFSSPVRVTAGTWYIASYFTPMGFYAADEWFFDTEHKKGPLRAIGSRFYYGSNGGFPPAENSWHSTNYYADVLFVGGLSWPSDVVAPTSTSSSTSTSTTAKLITTTTTTSTTSPPTTAAPTTSAPPATSTTTAPTTTAPTTSTTAPPAGARPTNCAAQPSRCGYPDATNTGVPPGTSLRWSGSIAVRQAGQVIDGLDVHGDISVEAPNVVIRNTRVTATGGDFIIIVRPGADNVVIQDVEVMTPAGTQQDIACIFNVTDYKITVLRANIHGCSAGISSGGGLIKDNYIHDMASIPGLSHDDGIASNGGGGLTAVHNTVFNQYSQTATIAMFQDFGTQANNLIQDNLLAGGGYCVYGGKGQYGATRNIRILDNRFSRKFFSECGYWGYLASFSLGDSGNAWSGNYWDDNLATVGP